MTSVKRVSRSNFAPAIAISGIGLLILLSTYRALSSTGFLRMLTAALACAYVLWIASEWRITTSAASQDTSTDLGTCERYAIARFLTVFAAFGWDPVWSVPGAWLPIGVAGFACGVGLRAWAIYTLGQSYSHRVRTPTAQAIIRHGPYRWLRHPAYAGMLLAHVGLLILLFNWFALLVLLGLFIPALVQRIRVEEAHLAQIPQYRAFAAGRARLAPGIW